MTTKTAQFTPLKKAVHAIPMLYAEAFAGSNNKEFVVELYKDARLLETAAPAMYEALQIMVRAANVDEIDPLVMFASIERARHVLKLAEGKSA